MRIKQLENELGVPLFYRNGKGVTLTSNGEILLTYAKQIIHLMDQSIKAVQSNGTDPKGTLKIGCTESTTAVRLSSILTAYYERYPEVELILETNTTEQLIKLVLERKLDGAFIAGSTQHNELHTTVFHEEELVLISKKPLSSLTDIEDMNLLAFSHGCYYRSLLEDWLQEEDISPKRVLEFGTIEAILAYVKSNMGVAIMMKSILKGHEHDISFNPLPNSFKRFLLLSLLEKTYFAQLHYKNLWR